MLWSQNRCGNASKKIAILKQLQTHFKAKHEKIVGTSFPRVSAPLHPWVVHILEVSSASFDSNKRIHLSLSEIKRVLSSSILLIPAFPPRRFAGVTVLGAPHGFQQFQIVLLAPYRTWPSRVGDVNMLPGPWSTSGPLSRECVTSRTCLAHLSWDTVVTWPNVCVKQKHKNENTSELHVLCLQTSFTHINKLLFLFSLLPCTLNIPRKDRVSCRKKRVNSEHEHRVSQVGS